MRERPSRIRLMETWLIIACVVAVFVIAVAVAYRSGNKHAKVLHEFAQARGWSYSRTDTQGITATVEALFPEQKFNLANVMSVESRGRKLYLFECGYRWRRGRGGSFGAAALIESDRFRVVGSHVEIVERAWSDALLLAEQVEMEDSEFAQSFIVLSKDPAAARRVARASLQQVLIEHLKAPLRNPVQIALGPSGAVLLTGQHAEPKRWLDLVELAQRLESALQ